jgi:hypothetical protein
MRGVESEEGADLSDVLVRVCGIDRDHRHVHVPPDDLGDLMGRYPFVADRAEHRTRRSLLQREAVQARGIETMYRRPAV